MTLHQLPYIIQKRPREPEVVVKRVRHRPDLRSLREIRRMVQTGEHQSDILDKLEDLIWRIENAK